MPQPRFFQHTDDMALKRLALQIVLQLPTDQAHAHRVLDLIKEQLDGWLHQPGPPEDATTGDASISGGLRLVES
jgi:hypothetical protein